MAPLKTMATSTAVITTAAHLSGCATGTTLIWSAGGPLAALPRSVARVINDPYVDVGDGDEEVVVAGFGAGLTSETWMALLSRCHFFNTFM